MRKRASGPTPNKPSSSSIELFVNGLCCLALKPDLKFEDFNIAGLQEVN